MNSEPFMKIFFKSLTMPKKNCEGPFGIFQHPFCCKTPKKMKGGPFGGKKFLIKSRTVPKKILFGKPFWFSSLGQQVKFEIL